MPISTKMMTVWSAELSDSEFSIIFCLSLLYFNFRYNRQQNIWSGKESQRSGCQSIRQLRENIWSVSQTSKVIESFVRFGA